MSIRYPIIDNVHCFIIFLFHSQYLVSIRYPIIDNVHMVPDFIQETSGYCVSIRYPIIDNVHLIQSLPYSQNRNVSIRYPIIDNVHCYIFKYLYLFRLSIELRVVLISSNFLLIFNERFSI